MRRAVEPLELRPFRELIDRVQVPLRRHLRAVFLPLALPLLVSSSAFYALYAQLFSQMGAFGEAAVPAFDSFIPLVVLLVVAGIVVTALYVASAAVGMVVAMQVLRGEAPQVVAAWRWVLRLRVLGTLALAGVLSLASLLACGLPFLLVGPLLTFVVPVMVDEQRTGMAAIRRSASLVWTNASGRFADSPLVQILVVYFVTYAVQNGLTAVVQLPAAIFQQWWMLREGASGMEADPLAAMSSMMWVNLPVQILGSLAAVIGLLWTAFATSALFFETRKRLEASDLAAAIQTLDRSVPETP